MDRVIAWFATNHIAANLLLILIVLAGLSAVLTMPQKSFPDIDVPIVTVTIPYLGAAPEEVEQGVCIRVEEELDGIEGVKEIRSV
ncbi:MAG: efflux RND transporter permease subunit, partial [Pseudomonadales bacterium]